MSDYYDLGGFGHTVSTTSAEAQLWFDRGLNWCYGFNHEEAVRCFERAVAADPDCAMAHWGIAYASGPNYNKPWEAFDAARAADALATRPRRRRDRARALADAGAPLERALIEALPARYPERDPLEDCAPLERCLRRRHARRLHRASPTTSMSRTSFAEALIEPHALAAWDLAPASPPTAPTRSRRWRCSSGRIGADPARGPIPACCTCTST